MATGKTRARRALRTSRPAPTAPDELVRALLEALHHAELHAFTNPSDEHAGSVDAILRTLVIALRRSDGAAVQALGNAARKQARRMQCDAGNAETESLGAWLALFAPPFGARTAIAFHGRTYARKGSRERVAFVHHLVQQLDTWLKSNCDSAELAGRFVDVAYETQGWPILDGRAPVDRTAAIEPVASAFGDILRACKQADRPPVPERVLVAGYRALGVNEAAAEALLRALDQRETRAEQRGDS